MTALLATAVEAQASHTLFWAWAAATLLLATGLGFVAGLLFGRRSADRGFRKAVKKLSTLYVLALDTLDKAHQVALLLEKFPQLTLTAEQVDGLDVKRNTLVETVSRMVGKQREILAKQVDARLKPKSESLTLEWQRTSIDPSTNLPDRAMFDANVRMMLEAGAKAKVSSGLLLIKIDRMDQLKSRFGLLGVDTFLKTMAAVLARAIRDQDLACRLSPDSFAVLLPSVDNEAGRKLSQAIRNSIRVHTFRMNDGGPEVLVTASFGFTTCAPNEDPGKAVTQAADALAQSIRSGRNQLHVVEGDALVHCTAG